MKAEFEICRSKECDLQITGLEVANESYSETISSTPAEFTYLDTVAIDGIYKVSSEEEEVLKDFAINVHHLETLDDVVYDVPDETTFKLGIDGEYKIVHVIIPKYEWVAEFIEAFGVDPTTIYEIVYVYKDNNVYQYDGTTFTKVLIEDVFTNYSTTDVGAYSTIYSNLTTFSMCKLERCLFNIDSKLLHSYCPANCNKTSFLDLIWKRDFLWMAKYVMTYLLEKGNFMEALRIMEQFQGCNDFCQDDNKVGGSGCGCGVGH